jgi:hypothetical protein
VSVTVVVLDTALVVTVNVALVDPAATVTLAGTCAALVLLLDSDTLAPPLGAAPLNVTVPVAELPPVTLVGLTDTPDNVTVDEPPTNIAKIFRVICCAAALTGPPLKSSRPQLQIIVPAAKTVAPLELL